MGDVGTPAAVRGTGDEVAVEQVRGSLGGRTWNVVITFLPRTAPAIPSSRMRRSTVQRTTTLIRPDGHVAWAAPEGAISPRPSAAGSCSPVPHDGLDGTPLASAS
jgi:hypothetical protein